jgi:hypothetical protein
VVVEAGSIGKGVVLMGLLSALIDFLIRLIGHLSFISSAAELIEDALVFLWWLIILR